jgi:protein-disulfide isomerase
MPSGKRSKARRRDVAPPPVRSKGGGGTRQASPRVLLAVAGAVVVAAVVVTVVVLATRGSSHPSAASTVTTGSVETGLPGAAEAAALYRGIPQHGLRLGSTTAPVRMIVYIDLQCPVCRAFETTSTPVLVRRYVRPGKVQLELRPWAFIGPDSVRGQAATIAAAKQDRAFQFAQVLYDNQGTENTGWLTDDMIRRIAASVPGLDVPKLMADRSMAGGEAATVAREVQQDGVGGTPTVFVGPRGASPSLVGSPESVPTTAQVASAIESSLGS